MNKLSSRQQAILKYIQREVREKGYPPSVREIGEAVGLASSSTVHGHLSRLEKKGFIRRDPTKPRAIELLLKEESDTIPSTPLPDTVMIPMLGKVTAGDPITAIENIEEYYPLPKRLMKNVDDPLFLLTIQGNSMINAGILSGDYVVVRRQQTANNGEIVVAMTNDGEATVKRFYKEADHIRLQPENDQLEPIRLPQVTVLGKVISLIREVM
ncbi:transcriptional repressor LexA [Thermoactinomyces sp. DSM 45892]|uniref:transcriptional repressor LexA n=1 Tax=Thermoactinomyces sp. DSM 45892 TaxID=1882753 RepID=UPI00089BAFD2|nr:transcriptional repressor LexA [Thermoactinomyces sp. DSM 45892]SDY51938.1 SOS-response transcriptional repressor, LexA [Thermoactinomyces sp. DSM 45892]